MITGTENLPTATVPVISVVSVGTTTVNLTGTTGGIAYIKAASGNSGTVTVNTATPVVAGTGWVLAAGEVTPPIILNSLAQLYVIGSAASQSISVWVQS